MRLRSLALEQARLRRRSTLVAAGVVATFFVVDAAAGYRSATTAAVRIAWVVIVAAVGVTTPSTPRFDPVRANTLAAVTVVAFTAIVWTTGGPSSVYFGYFYALPFAALALFPDASTAAAISALGAAVGGGALLAQAGAPLRTIAAFLGTCGGTCILAAYAARAFRSMRAAELTSERDRSQALADLAESERRRARAERLALVGQLAAGAAHEVNNPLSYVKSNVTWVRQALARNGDDTVELVQALAESETGLARIQAIVADLRAFSRGDLARTETCDPAQAVHEAVRLASMRVGRAARVSAAVPRAARPVRMSRTRLVQALVNLLVNAADAVEGAGRCDGHVTVKLVDDADHVVVSVADDGPGIPPSVAGHLFEPFFTTKGAQGTGLGLALTREYVERYGGTVEASDAPGGGAVFTLRLARAAAPEQGPNDAVSRTGTA